MNIRRGLLRLWIVGSIAWAVGVGYHGYEAYPPKSDHSRLTAEAEEVWARIERAEERKVIRSHLEWALGPPLVILVVGASLGWALAGFRGTRRGNTP
jgi:hypothetical protein